LPAFAYHPSTTKEAVLMRKLTISTVALAALAALGFLSVGGAFSATHSNATVSLRSTKIGKVLVTRSGHTLYLFKKDANGKSSCNGACASFWPPLLASGKPTAGAGVKAGMLGTTKRANGTRQVTYNRHPLYTFKLDTSAGQTNGQAYSAFGAKWYAVSAAGAAVVKAAPPGVTTTGTTTTSPYPNPYP
jgi:predicted lipoprotein with Yx(FWY)xxD motif